MARTRQTPRQTTPTPPTANDTNNGNDDGKEQDEHSSSNKNAANTKPQPKRKPPPNNNETATLVPRTPDRSVQHSPFITLSPAKYMKTVKDLGGAFKMNGKLPDQLYIKVAGGGLAVLLYCDEFGFLDAGYTLPLKLACDISQNPQDTSHNHQKYRDFIEQMNILCYMGRRISKWENKPKLGKQNKDGARYVQNLFLVHLEDQSNQGIKKYLEKIRDFMVAEKALVELRPKFNQTDYFNQALDHYIEDKYVLRVAQKIFKDKADDSFFEKQPSLRGCFFSHPYPPISEELGYPVVTIDDLSPNIEQEVAEAASPNGNATSPANTNTSRSTQGRSKQDPIKLDMTP